MKINIVLPYENSEKSAYIWAKEEKEINWRKDFYKASRCTLAYSATELAEYLKKMNFDVCISEKSSNDFNIFIKCESISADDDSFTLSPVKNGLEIIGKSRIGALYGAYEFLKLQGVRWLNPDDEIIPDIKELFIPDKKIIHSSAMPLGRGFDFEGLLKDSTKLWQWMARNKLNLSAYRPHTAAFQKKLGMSFKMGGHIFERLLNPDNVAENGKTFWEAHRDWYGEKNIKEKALSTQFCMTNKECSDYLCEEILKCLNNEWYEADRVDIWTFDTWGKSCQCENCRKLGNSTDKTLHFLSQVRTFIDKAIQDGRLDHDIRIVGCAYEGTGTLEPPLNPIPRNLKNNKDYLVFYPINRCYMHEFGDEACEDNLKYKKALQGWQDMPLMLGEYWNVSKFEDLPYIFKNVMTKDLKFYKENGIGGMTYMHLPMLEWGMRNLTQSLYAELCDNINTEAEKFINQYYKDRYAEQWQDVKKAYDHLEEAAKYCSHLRAWNETSLLSVMQAEFDGKKPEKPLFENNHLGGRAYEICENSAFLYEKALKIFKECKNKRFEYIFNAKKDEKQKRAVNPLELAKNKKDAVIKHYDEDIRLTMYGRDVMKLTALLLKYYKMLFKSENTNELWEEIETLAEDMSYRYMPLTYINSQDNIELQCRDILDRSQLREIYYKCKQNRF